MDEALEFTNDNKRKDPPLEMDSAIVPPVEEATTEDDAPLTKRARATKEDNGNNNNDEEEDPTSTKHAPQAHRRFRRPASSANAQEWHAMYKLLKQFKEEHGHILPKRTETYQDLPLGQWVYTMREAYREEALGAKRQKAGPATWVITLLNDIGFDWGEFNDAPPFDELVQILQEYKDVNGHVSPEPRETYAHYKVGYWVQQLRQNYKVTMDDSNPRQPLTPEQIQRLEDMGLEWSTDDVLDDTIVVVPAAERHVLSWDEMANLLQAYKEEKGHVNPDPEERFRDCNIGFWCAEQRKLYKRKDRQDSTADSRLSDERIQRLEAMGFGWTRPRKKRRYEGFNQKWASMLELLKVYLAEFNGEYPK